MQSKEAQILNNIQNYFICPIMQCRLCEPVVTIDGHTFQKNGITQWLKKSNKSPLTNLALRNKQITANHLVKSIIDYFYENLVPNIKRMFAQIQYLKDQLLVKDIYIEQLLREINTLKYEKKNTFHPTSPNLIFQKKESSSSTNKSNLRNQSKNLSFNDFIGVQKPINLSSENGQIPSILSKIIDLSAKQIQAQIQKRGIYIKITQTQCRGYKNNFNNVGLSTDGYIFWLDKMKVDIEKLVKYQWKQVQVLLFYQVNITKQSLQTFIKSAKAFPNLKALRIQFCNFDDNMFDIIIQNLNQFPTLQGIGLNGNKITCANQDQLNKIAQKKLKTVIFHNNPLTQPAMGLMRSFKQRNRQVYLQF